MIHIPASEVAHLILQSLMCRKHKTGEVRALRLHSWNRAETTLQAGCEKARAA